MSQPPRNSSVHSMEKPKFLQMPPRLSVVCPSHPLSPSNSHSLSCRSPHPHWLIFLPQDLCTCSFCNVHLSDSQMAHSPVSLMIFLKCHLVPGPFLPAVYFHLHPSSLPCFIFSAEVSSIQHVPCLFNVFLFPLWFKLRTGVLALFTSASFHLPFRTALCP